MQTRRFETANYDAMLTSASAVFQDLGFNLDESERNLGVLVGSKKRSAYNPGQVAGAVFLALFTGVVTSVDKEQTIRASLVMREIEDPNAPKKEVAKTSEPVRAHTSKKGKGKSATAPTAPADKQASSTVRVTFQRVIINEHGQATRMEQINEPKLYQEFFDKLSQAVFLEAHEI
jgi:hypothetical protein